MYINDSGIRFKDEKFPRNINIMFYTTFTAPHKEIIIEISVFVFCNMNQGVRFFLRKRSNPSITVNLLMILSYRIL